MNARTYCSVSAVVFTVVAVAHLVRAVGALPLLIGTWQVPVGLSWVGAVVAAGLAVWGFRQATRGE